MRIARDALKFAQPALLPAGLHEHLLRQVERDDQCAGVAILKQSRPVSCRRAQIQHRLGLQPNHVQAFEQPPAYLAVDGGSCIEARRRPIERATYAADV